MVDTDEVYEYSPEPRTPRERQVHALVKQGKRNKDIASLLTISLSTVEFHITNLRLKLRVDTRVELALAPLD